MAHTIWLGRGAPRRWFGTDGGFSVSNAPTVSAGAVTFDLSLTGQHSAFYRVQYDIGRVAAKGAGPILLWSLRWAVSPAVLREEGLACVGCVVVATDLVSGVATVYATAAKFSVNASWDPPKTDPGSVLGGY